LSIKPSKTVVIPFTKKRALKGLKETTLFGKTIRLPTQIKYLRPTLDKRNVLTRCEAAKALTRAVEPLTIMMMNIGKGMT
jgi:hypothetical protein